ncbi:MAG: hypothetical protein IJ169_01195 [Paludibacteraceae bacterium]|nr:hypothetical protein [Paludibacteraceae bacterium]
MYLKPDAALLVNDKPFFLPAFSEEVVASPCVVVRISRMGRNIAPRFAGRYYDSCTLGLNFHIPSLLAAGGLGNSLRATAFDNSLAVGRFSPSLPPLCRLTEAERSFPLEHLLMPVDEALAEISRYITFRMGDMVAVDFVQEPLPLAREQRWQAWAGEEQLLLCKIK